MDSIASWPAPRRQLLFLDTAFVRNMRPALIEKDFWVCWTLARLFSLDAHPTLVFKGGTALSKVYAAITRFSEDVDLSFDRSVFGLDDAVRQAATATQREKVLKEIDQRAKRYVADALLPDLQRAVRATLGAGEWQLTVEKGKTRHWDEVFFHYPRCLADDAYRAAYNQPVVRIEVVARGRYWPDRAGTVMPYAAEAFPGVFTNSSAAVRALTSECTFWEKATILHREYHVADAKPAKPRLSRHYADLAALASTQHGHEALRDLSLLIAVAEHKAVYFREPAAQYETARPGTLRLMPANSRRELLRTDYHRMAGMFFQRPPSFEAILDTLRDLEDRINADSESAATPRTSSPGPVGQG